MLSKRSTNRKKVFTRWKLACCVASYYLNRTFELFHHELKVKSPEQIVCSSGSQPRVRKKYQGVRRITLLYGKQFFTDRSGVRESKKFKNRWFGAIEI